MAFFGLVERVYGCCVGCAAGGESERRWVMCLRAKAGDVFAQGSAREARDSAIRVPVRRWCLGCLQCIASRHLGRGGAYTRVTCV
jgi:hypothetical protein